MRRDIMAIIQPFAAIRPRPEWAAALSAPPYDVLSTGEARLLAADNPLSFLRVTKPEIELPPTLSPYAPEVYQRGRENFNRLLQQGALHRQPQAAFYLYRQAAPGHAQTGWVALASVREYEQQIIRRHELTRLDKENDRAAHIATVKAQTGPAFLVYRDTPELAPLADLAARASAGPPDVDFTAADGVRHTAWTVADPADIALVKNQFAMIPRLYIADGHHRTAAAARVSRQLGGGASAWFLAVIFSHRQLRIWPYNRVLKDLNRLAPGEFLERLNAVMDKSPGNNGCPQRPHEVALYLEGRWRHWVFRDVPHAATHPQDLLDAALLQQRVLHPILAIQDPRTSQRLQFVDGTQGASALERIVDSGQFACAFSLFPLAIEDLMAVADAGGVLPPKSTWFAPKLRDGLFVHQLSEPGSQPPAA